MWQPCHIQNTTVHSTFHSASGLMFPSPFFPDVSWTMGEGWLTQMSTNSWERTVACSQNFEQQRISASTTTHYNKRHFWPKKEQICAFKYKYLQCSLTMCPCRRKKEKQNHKHLKRKKTLLVDSPIGAMNSIAMSFGPVCMPSLESGRGLKSSNHFCRLILLYLVIVL